MSKFLEALEQVDLFGSEQVLVESTYVAEGSRFTINERARGPTGEAAKPIPASSQRGTDPMMLVQANGATARQDLPTANYICDFAEQSGTWMRVRINKDQPFAAGGRGPPIACPPDLINRLENHLGASATCQVCRSVRGVVVAHDNFVLPPACGQSLRGFRDLLEGSSDQLLLVVGRYDDR